MARTQAADYDKKREAITDQAAKLFARDGFAGASVSELAALCRVSKSLIYHYYPSKETILFDVMSAHIEDLLDITLLAANKSLTPEEELRTVTRTLLRHYVGAADKQKVLLYELAALSNKQREDIVFKQRKIIALVEAILARSKPSLKRDRARLRAKVMLFFGMLNWTHTWFKPRGAISRDELAEMAADTILKSL
ncbi:MAG: TetR/AcrR family transcriptional regulator [Alphaproteobacteria bacterium]|nr:TetR/AcrR family transcriptional regulator [Alphaproteobacteria bacterium]